MIQISIKPVRIVLTLQYIRKRQMKIFFIAILTCAFAADSSNCSFNDSNDNEAKAGDFSNLASLEDVHDEAAAVITKFMNSIKVLDPSPPSKGYDFQEVFEAEKFARKAREYFTIGSESYKKIDSVYVSAKSSRKKLAKILDKKVEKDKVMKYKNALKLYYTYVPRCNEAIKDVIEGLKTINFSEFSLPIDFFSCAWTMISQGPCTN